MDRARSNASGHGTTVIVSAGLSFKAARTLLICGAAALLIGTTAPAAAEGAVDAAAPYLLSPGDRVSITVFDQPDISGTYLVEPTGAIALPLLGVMDVTQFTAHDLQAELVARFGDGYLQNPVINVRLLELRPVTIVGQVRAPGRYGYVDGMSVDTAMALAGGGAQATGEEASRRLELLQAEGRLQTLTVAHLSQLAQKARLEAQLAGAQDFEAQAVDPQDAALLDRLMAGQREMLASETAAQERQLSLLSQQAQTIEGDIQTFTEQVELENEQITFLDVQIDDFSGLLVNGLTRKSAVIEVQREKSRSRSNLARILGDLSRSRSALTEANLRLQEVEAAYRSRSMAELQTVNVQLAETEGNLRIAREDRQIRLDRLPPGARDLAGPEVMTISRYGLGGVETFAADGTTPIRPGDILQVGDGSGAGTVVTPALPAPAPLALDQPPREDGGPQPSERLSQSFDRS